jgi:hypothetical protein
MGYEVVIREKELAFDAQLAATEIVRRCDRRVAELVKIQRPNGAHLSPSGDRSAREVLGGSGRSHAEHSAMAAASAETFDAAIDEARAEGNLSRANVHLGVMRPESAGGVSNAPPCATD